MPKDYARKKPTRQGAVANNTGKRARAPARAKKTRQPASPGNQSGGLSLRWILALAAVGGFIGFIVYLNTLPVPQSGDGQPHTAVEAPVPVPEPAPEPEQKYRFYDMLPDSEVVPPTVEEYAPGPERQGFLYLVQTGSFRSEQDAERQRAEIAFQGLRASVKRIDLDNGSVWFRVNVGPFDSRSKMNSAIDRLVSINIEPLVRKIPQKDE